MSTNQHETNSTNNNDDDKIPPKGRVFGSLFVNNGANYVRYMKVCLCGYELLVHPSCIAFAIFSVKLMACFNKQRRSLSVQLLFLMQHHYQQLQQIIKNAPKRRRKCLNESWPPSPSLRLCKLVENIVLLDVVVLEERGRERVKMLKKYQLRNLALTLYGMRNSRYFLS